MADTAAALVIQLTAETRQFQREMRNATGVFDKEGRAIERRQAQLRKRLEASWSGFSRVIVPSLAGIGAALSTREIVQYADAWRNAGNKLASSGTPLDDVQARLEQLSEAATNSRTSFDTTAAAYQRLRIATERLGVSEKDALRYTELINKSFIAGGASGTEAASAALQLSQALGSGTLQGDELRSLRENAPLLAQAIADAMGTSIGGLKALGAQGKITADIILKALNQSAASIEERFGKTQETVSQAFTNLETAFTRFVGSASGDELNAMAGSIDFLAKHLDDATKIIGIAAAALGPAGLVAGARAASVAVGALWAIMAANPVGAVLAVVSAAAAALYLYREKLVPANEAVTKSEEAHRLLIKALGDGNKEIKKVAQSDYDRAKAANAAALADLKSAEALAKRNIVMAKAQELSGRVDVQTGLLIPGTNKFDQKRVADAEAQLRNVQQQIAQNRADAAKLLAAKGKVVPDPQRIVPPPAPTPPVTAGSLSGIREVSSTPRIGAEAVAKILADGDKMIAQIKTEGDVIGMTSAQAEAYRWKVQALADISREYGGVTEEQAAQVDAIAAALLRAGEATDHLREMQEAYLQHQEDIARENEYVARGLGDVAVAGLRGFGSLKDAAADFLGSLAEMILRVQVLDPLLKNLGGGSGGIFNSILGAFGAADLGSTVSASIAANPLLFKNGGIARNGRSVSLPMMADGGVSRRPAIISEYGQPEAAVPLPDGRRIPVDLRMPAVPSITPSAASAPVIVQHFDLSGAVVTDDIIARAQAAGESAATTRLQQFNSLVLPGRVRQLVTDPYRAY